MTHRTIALCVTILSLLGCTTGEVRRLAPSRLSLSFVIDKDYDQRAVIAIFRGDDPAGLANRAISMGVDLEVARQIHDAGNVSAIKEIAERTVEGRFKEKGTDIQASRDAYPNQWKDLLPVFSDVVVETTQSPWVHREYTCVVSSIFPGLSDWSGSKVAVRFGYDPAYACRILAHEIVLSDVFQLLRKRYNVSQIGDWQVWGFSEITAGFILDDQKLQQFWPEFPHGGAYSGYSQLPALEKQLQELFDRRTSYIDYEDKSASVLRSFQPFRSQFGWLGVFLRDIQNGNTSAWQFAEEMQLTGIKGAFIAGVYRGSPADSAGLVAGDYVTAVASTQIGSAAQLTETIASLSAGTKTDFTVLRLGKTKNLLVTIGQRDAGDAVVRPENLWPGITVEDLTTEIRGKGQIPPTVGGVVVASVTDARSPGARAGLKPGDLIIGANGVNIETIMDFYRALDTADGKNTTLAVFRAGSEITVGLQ